MRSRSRSWRPRPSERVSAGVGPHVIRHFQPLPERDHHVNRSRLAALSAGAMFLVATVFAPSAALAAGTGTLRLVTTPVTTTVGSSFSLDIVTNASVATEGA